MKIEIDTNNLSDLDRQVLALLSGALPLLGKASTMIEKLTTQTGDGAATPPATAQGVDAPSAAESATAVGAAEAAPFPSTPAEKPKRKRRTNAEIAYDEALEACEDDPSEYNTTKLVAATDALRAKDPFNERFANGNPLDEQGAEAPGVGPAATAEEESEDEYAHQAQMAADRAAEGDSPVTEDETASVTREQLVELAGELIAKDRAAMVALLASYDVKRLSDLPADSYDRMASDIRTALEG